MSVFHDILGTLSYVFRVGGAEGPYLMNSSKILKGVDKDNSVIPRRLMPFVKTESSSFTLTADDHNQMIGMNGAGAKTITLPKAATEALGIGFMCYVQQVGAGTVTFAIE